MAETTTTTTKAPETTTTTTRKPDTTTTTTVDAAPAEQNQPEKRGEVAVDQGAEAKQLKEQSAEERLDDAKQEGLRNHRAEHANDAATNNGDPTSRDKE